MGYPVEQQKYQSLGNLRLLFPKADSVSNYKRWLDLDNAISGVSYSINGVQYQREVFASEPDQVIAIRITADHSGSISFSANLRGVRNQTHSNYATDYFRMDPYGNDGLILTGKSADYMGVEGKIRRHHPRPARWTRYRAAWPGVRAPSPVRPRHAPAADRS